MSDNRFSGYQDHFEIIQQWQYTGKVDPRLLTDKAIHNCKEFGITSLQSYVTWAEIEKKPRELDFSTYDVLVEKLFKHNLKWVPFLILGPYYATPQWFQESEHNLYAKCLEHRKTSKIQSIWNPYLPEYIQHFLSSFAHHYADHTIFESIALGISGNWGEAIYPATGCFIGNFHTHPGWWCGDDHGSKSFQQAAAKRYASLRTLNSCWGTHFRSFSEVTFPRIERSLAKDVYYHFINMIPGGLKPILSRVRSGWRKTIAPWIYQLNKHFHEAQSISTSPVLQRWIDFTDWYQKSMTDWAEFWIKTARKNFPTSEIYLVTGGEGEPILGADFSAQTKAAAKYNAGIRITNQNDDYGESFIRTRLVACASRHYGAYFTTEEAGVNRSHGVTMRIFDAVTSGAKGAYFKSIIGTGTNLCGGRNLTPGEPTEGAKNLSNNRHYLSFSNPVINVAVLFPHTSIATGPSLLSSLYQQCSKLRAFIDFDLVDENMITDNSLKNYRFLVVLEGNWVRSSTLAGLKDWISEGGILVSADFLSLTGIENEIEIYNVLFSKTGNCKAMDCGYTLQFRGGKGSYLSFVAGAIINKDKKYPWEGLTSICGTSAGQYATHFPDKVMYYDPKQVQIRVQKAKDSRESPSNLSGQPIT